MFYIRAHLQENTTICFMSKYKHIDKKKIKNEQIQTCILSTKKKIKPATRKYTGGMLKGSQEKYKRKKESKKPPTSPQIQPALPTTQPSQKMQQRSSFINTIQICPRPKVANKDRFHPMFRELPIIKDHYVPFKPYGLGKTKGRLQ